MAVRYVLVTNGTRTLLLGRRADGSGYDPLSEIPESFFD